MLCLGLCLLLEEGRLDAGIGGVRIDGVSVLCSGLQDNSGVCMAGA